MTDKSTHKQIINKAYKIANSISHFSQNETAKEILTIAIKSPEAAEYWRKKERQQCIDAAKAVKKSKYDDDFSVGMECMRENIIKALEVQSE